MPTARDDKFYDVELVEREQENLMGLSSGLDVRKSQKASSHSNRLKKQQNKSPCWGKVCAAGVATILVVIGVVLAFELPKKRRRQQQQQKQQSSSASEPRYSIDYLQASPLAQVLTIPTLEQVLVKDSPQSQAFGWVENHPELLSMPDWRKRQLLALSTIYYATGGDTVWRQPQQVAGDNSCAGIEVFWQSYEVNECYWSQRNRCTANGKYSELVLGHVCGLQGSIPPEISFLTALTAFEIQQSHHNHLGGALPSEFGLLTALEELQLSDSQLLGPTAKDLAQLTRLQVLAYHPIASDDPLPTELGLLQDLEDLRVSFTRDTRCSGGIPSQLGLLTQLSYLQANSLFLKGTIPSELMSSNMTQLTSLLFSRNVLTGSIPTSLATMETLQELTLDHNLLTGAIACAGSSSLLTLEVDCDRITCSCCKCDDDV